MTTKHVHLDEFIEKSNKSSNTNHIVYSGDIFSSLLRIEDNSIDCAVTSPPYWNQRDYGFENQIGNEDTIDEYIEKLTISFSVLKEKLKDMGIFYLNLGDKYLSKYGNTPLGLIPYKLVLALLKNGWILQDTLIWFKPNHMPSSVKNRFTNTYEPIFVLAKNEENFFLNYLSSPRYSNILAIPLQQNTYKHIATFPEALIKSLIELSNLPPNSTILDPFAGSGTTSLCIKNLNSHFTTSYSSISIEAKKEFVDILQKRCKIPKKNIIVIKPIQLSKNLIKVNSKKVVLYNHKFKTISINYKSKNLIIKSINTDTKDNILQELSSDEFYTSLDEKGILLLKIDFLNPFLLVAISEIPKWIIRNILIIKEGKIGIPIILIVKDTKLVRYKFNLDAVREDHLTNSTQSWSTINFIGMKVIQSKTILKHTKEGIITHILSQLPNNFPEFVVVHWNDDSATIEETINFTNSNADLVFECPSCKTKLENYFQNRVELKCSSCKLILWSDFNTIPQLKISEKNKPNETQVLSNSHQFQLDNTEKTIQSNKSNYKGKFSLDDKINRGQSPGARLSVTEQYFFVSRYYSIRNGLYAKYLNLILKKLHITKSELTKKFPDSYNHTIGHWFRYDMGSSLPKIEDLDLFEKTIQFKLNKEYKKLLTKTGIKFQSVIPDNRGKNPGDILEISLSELIIYFQKIVS